jgi:hypothetical protein
MPVPNVKWRTPDDGQRNCPKHVDFLDKNKFGKISASVGFITKKFVTTQHGHMNVKENVVVDNIKGLLEVSEGYELTKPNNTRKKQYIGTEVSQLLVLNPYTLF